MTQLKVLLWDIETAPLLAYIWRPFDDYVPYDRLVNDSWLICWSAKWLNGTKVFTGTVTSQEAIDQDDGRIVQDLADLIRMADIIVGHNGDKFDLPMFNARLLALGLEPLGPVQTIDTYKLARQNFRLAYNKLDYLGEKLGVGRKLKTDFNLWRQAYYGDESALKKMTKYNIQDVHMLEGVFHKLLPYAKSVKRLVDPVFEDEFACPSCGGVHLMKRGWARTQSATYQRYQCSTCKRYSRSRKAEKPKFSVVPL